MIQEIWPIRCAPKLYDQIALKFGFHPGYCVICGSITVFKLDNPNFREHVICLKCRSVNRQRQIAMMVLSCLMRDNLKRLPSLVDLPKNLVVWNTETTRSLHEALHSHLGSNYFSSEFISPSLNSGEIINGCLHVDMQKTHFDSNFFDVVISSDVLEHIPSPLEALREVYRILKPGGVHIFTVPFYEHRFSNEKRVKVHVDSTLTYLRHPWYHDDPMRSDGALVYNIFAPELLSEMETIGFESRLCKLYSPFFGIFGVNGLVIFGKKMVDSYLNKDWVFPETSSS